MTRLSPQLRGNEVSLFSAVNIKRFWAKVEKTDTCWIWTGGRQRGYGRYNVPAIGTMAAHRVSYQLAYGAFDPVLDVLHECDNPSCVRPSHLFLGTPVDNARDMIAKGRQGDTGSRGEANRHAKLTENQVREIFHIVRSGTVTPQELAARYDVKPHCIYSINSGRSWRHLRLLEQAS